MNRALLLRQMFPGIVIGPGGEGEECVLGEAGIAEWNRPEKQPTDDELKAVEAAALAAQEAEAVKVAESTAARDDAKRALTALDTIIANMDRALVTTEHLKAAVKQLAQIQKHIILATVGR